MGCVFSPKKEPVVRTQYTPTRRQVARPKTSSSPAPIAVPIVTAQRPKTSSTTTRTSTERVIRPFATTSYTLQSKPVQTATSGSTRSQVRSVTVKAASSSQRTKRSTKRKTAEFSDLCDWTEYWALDTRIKELSASIQDIAESLVGLRAQVPVVEHEYKTGWSEEYRERKLRRLEGLLAKIQRVEAARERKTQQLKRVKRMRDVEKRLNRVISWAGRRSEDSLWREICVKLTGQSAHTTLECKQILAEEQIFINIFDFVEGKYELVWRTVGQLQGRCEETGYFPLKRAKSTGLRALLVNFSKGGYDVPPRRRPDTSKQHECAQCRKRFSSKPALAQHRRDKHSGRSAQTSDAQRKAVLKQHSRSAQPLEEARDGQCMWCDRVFGSESAVRQHERDKHGATEADWDTDDNGDDSVFACPSCNRSFFSPHALAQHRTAKSH